MNNRNPRSDAPAGKNRRENYAALDTSGAAAIGTSMLSIGGAVLSVSGDKLLRTSPPIHITSIPYRPSKRGTNSAVISNTADVPFGPPISTSGNISITSVGTHRGVSSPIRIKVDLTKK
jgi:hypothetical protein